jgi:hypothetical protein
MHRSDFVSPDQSTLLQSINSKLLTLPESIPSSSDLQAVQSLLQDVWDGVLGNWTLDQAQNILTFFRASGPVLQAFILQKTQTTSSRVRQTS